MTSKLGRISENVDKIPPLGEGFVQRTSKRFGRILSNVTIEPALFLIMFSSGIDNVANSQMVLIKSCRNDFPEFNDTICDNLNDPAYHDENIMVSNELNQFNVYKQLITSIFPVFFSFYLGAWADIFGRKFLFYIFLTAYASDQAITLVCAYYFDSPKEYMLFASVPTALSGGFAVWMLSINAFITDISSPENRAFRFGMLHLATGLGSPLSPPVGAYLLKTGGYVCVFATSLTGIVLGAILLIWRIRKYKWNPERKPKVRFLISD